MWGLNNNNALDEFEYSLEKNDNGEWFARLVSDRVVNDAVLFPLLSTNNAMEDLLAFYSSDSINDLSVRYTSSLNIPELASQYFKEAAGSIAVLAQDLSEESVISRKKDNDTQGDDTSTEDTSTEEGSAEDTSTDDISTEESTTDDTPTEESTTDDTQAEESSNDDTSTEENLIEENFPGTFKGSF